ncbi:hypothetical protein G6F68_013414 [Rhizopus microsporus]|nr:hypothetical protein G6F68_013414 [Rhizopus microsporus]
MRCIQHHLARVRGHVEVPRLGTAHLHPVQRPMRIQRARVRPAILIHTHCADERLPAGELRGRRFSLPCRHGQQRLACPRRPRTDVAAAAHHIGGFATQRGQRHGFRLGLYSVWQRRQPSPIDGITQHRQRRQALTGCQLWIADEQHHHAADEPQQHQQASSDAQPAMHQVGPALGGGTQRHGPCPQKR